jgi:hypothetical protein
MGKGNVTFSAYHYAKLVVQKMWLAGAIRHSTMCHLPSVLLLVAKVALRGLWAVEYVDEMWPKILNRNEQFE